MEFRDVIRRRRMVRSYDTSRPVPRETVDLIVATGLRAPSGGFTQGWGFLVLDTAEDVRRFRDAVRPDSDAANWYAATFDAPVVVVAHSNKDAYLNRYAQPDKGFTDRSDSWWPAPFWDIDTGFAAMLMLLAAVDEGLGACFFGLPKEKIDNYRAAFGVPDTHWPIGAMTFGYSEEKPVDLRARRKGTDEVVHRGHWAQPSS
jgi:nitroreductase